MLVVINGRLYDAEKTPIVIFLDPVDKLRVHAMPPEQGGIFVRHRDVPEKKAEAIGLRAARMVREYMEKKLGKKQKS